jgi:integrase
MVTALQGTSKIVVAVAALTGLRLSELRGLRWSDYDGEALHVTRSVWRTHVNEPKTRESVAPVPVLPILKEVLDRHRNNSADEAYIFSGPRGKPLNLANLARRVIIDKLSEKKLEWKGWHAFRRGLATNLSMLGVSARTVQAILRHSQISTTMRHYIQSPDTESVEAMRKLGDSLLVFGIR